MPFPNKTLINRLQKDILQWEGYRPPETGNQTSIGLGPIEAAFPNGVFPVGAVHEMVCATTEQATAGGALISGLLANLMQHGGVCLWIGLSGNLYPSALKTFEVDPERVIFVNLLNDRDVLWAMEEALKCPGLVMAVAEVRELNFKQSRRLQLAVEQSRVTGFILRNESKKLSATACAARWQVTPLPSQLIDGLPGLGFPRWRVDLLRVRNGQGGTWILEWADGKFVPVEQKTIEQQIDHYPQLLA